MARPTVITPQLLYKLQDCLQQKLTYEDLPPEFSRLSIATIHKMLGQLGVSKNERQGFFKGVNREAKKFKKTRLHHYVTKALQEMVENGTITREFLAGLLQYNQRRVEAMLEGRCDYTISELAKIGEIVSGSSETFLEGIFGYGKSPSISL